MGGIRLSVTIQVRYQNRPLIYRGENKTKKGCGKESRFPDIKVWFVGVRIIKNGLRAETILINYQYLRI